MLNNEQMRYPIGDFIEPVSYTADDMRTWRDEIAALPGLLRHAVTGLTQAQLDTPYREGGWTLQQVVHHLADSHMNSIIRFKLALTEENPVIKPYLEASWATLPDYSLPVEPSLRMLEGIHQHLTALFDSFTETQWQRTFVHPETKGTYTLKRTLALYAWHGKHHLAHITETKKRFGV